MACDRIKEHSVIQRHGKADSGQRAPGCANDPHAATPGSANEHENPSVARGKRILAKPRLTFASEKRR